MQSPRCIMSGINMEIKVVLKMVDRALQNGCQNPRWHTFLCNIVKCNKDTEEYKIAKLQDAGVIAITCLSCGPVITLGRVKNVRLNNHQAIIWGEYNDTMIRR